MSETVGVGSDVPVAQGPAIRGSSSTTRRRLTRLLEAYGLLGVWGLLILLFSVLRPETFFAVGTFKTIFGSQQPLVFLALALVCTFAVGEFDLSVASILGLAATMVTTLTILHDLNVVVASLLAVLAALVVGVVNGVLVVRLGIDPIVSTLGMSTLLLGVSSWMSRESGLSGLSRSFSKISSYPVLGLPISFFYGIVLAAIFAYVLGWTPLGRHMKFVGANREVARLAGVNVDRVRFGSYVVSSAFCGVGGVLLAANVGGFDANTSSAYLLPTFAAVFLGTVVVIPGEFNPVGSLIAIYFLISSIVGLQLLGFTGWISNVFYGSALIVAVGLSRLLRASTGRV